MRFRFTDRRSPCFAFTAWLCLALHLAVFTASGWHFHGSHGHAHGTGECGNVCAAHAESNACCPEGACECREHPCGHEGCDGACDQHTGGQERGDPTKAPRDGRDPEGCCICKAIFALHHAAPAVPVAVIVVLTDVPPEPLVCAQAITVAPQRRQWSRGPPMTGS